MRQEEYETAVAAFIRSKGITRCPTAYALPTQGTISAADRAALERHAIARGRSQREKTALQAPSFWAAKVSAQSRELAASHSRRGEHRR
jgi:hypothetical protein